MSDRPVIVPNLLKPIINNVSMATSITGPATILKNLTGISYDIQWTGTPTGTFQVQVSNTYSIDATGSVQNAGNWSTIPSAEFSGTYPIPSGFADTGFLDLVGTEAYAVRLVYTASMGSGNLTVIAAAKVF
jgi:hypothetical protein